MINSIKHLHSALKDLVKNAKNNPEENSSKHTIQESAIKEFLKPDLIGNFSKYFGHDNINIDLRGQQKMMTEKEISRKLTLEFAYILDRSNFNVTIINGEFCEAKSYLPKNVRITRLRDLTDEKVAVFFKKAPYKKNTLALINTALVKRGFLLEADISKREETIYINYVDSPDNIHFNQARNIYSVKKNAKLSVIERFFFLGEGLPAIKNDVSQWILEDGAQASLYMLDCESNTRDCKDINNIFVNQKNNSTFSCFSFYINVQHVIKNNLRVFLEGSGSVCNLFSLSLLDKYSCVEHDIYIEHKKPDCKSNQVYKGVFDNYAKGKFDSVILVHQDAQKTSAVQQNNSLLLSDNSMVQSNPQLEIFADDVECAHGATMGQIDEAALFYLRSRGIRKETAHNLLLRAFFEDIIEKIDNKEARKLVLMGLDKKLNTLN